MFSTAFDFPVTPTLRNADDTKVRLPMSGPDRLHCLVSPDFSLSWLHITLVCPSYPLPKPLPSHLTAEHSEVTDASHQAWGPSGVNLNSPAKRALPDPGNWVPHTTSLKTLPQHACLPVASQSLTFMDISANNPQYPLCPKGIRNRFPLCCLGLRGLYLTEE